MAPLLGRLARLALRRGIHRASPPWLAAAGLAALGAWLLRRPESVFRAELAPGEGLVVEHQPR
jgi:hypothetical protein